MSDPRDHAHLYLGTANGWIYESRNAGNSWRRLAQLGKRDDLVLASIVVDAQNSNHLVVGAWAVDQPDGGIFYSLDAGVTWSNQAEMRGQSIRSLAASLSDPKTLVAGTLKGVFRSRDGGMRWKRISADDEEIHNVESVAIDPTNPDIIYAGTWHLPWKTVDGGEHWDSMKQGIIDDSDVFSIIVDPVAPKVVFASACSGIYKSEDAGAQFHKIQGIPTTARRTRRLLQDPHHLETVFAGTTEGLFRSDDAGKSWTRTTGPELIINDVMVDLRDPRRVLIATDRGGVMASDDGGDTFHSSNAGFSARQVTTLWRDAAQPRRLLVGVVNDKEWGGVFESGNGGQTWKQMSDGLDGRDVFSLGQAPDGTLVAGTSHGLFRLEATQQVWTVAKAPALEDAGAAVAHVNLTRPSAGLAGSNTVVRARTTATRKPAPKIKPKTTAPRTASHRPGAKPLTKAQRLAANKKSAALAKTQPRARVASPATQRAAAVAAPIVQAPPPTVEKNFDGSVYAVITAGDTMLAATAAGLLSSHDSGATWTMGETGVSTEWRYLAAEKNFVLASSLTAMVLSADAGKTWKSVRMPEKLSQISAIAVEPTGQMWVGGRQGIFVSADGGATWTAPRDLHLNGVNNIFYDAATARLMITTSGNSSLVFTVQMPSGDVTFTDAGWNLRFARLLDDHIIAATLYDGIVVQPRMVASPMSMTSPSGRAGASGRD